MGRAPRATELQLYPPAAEVTVKALEGLAPAQFPPMRERVAPAPAASSELAVEPPILHAPW
ncbi:MAG: hypothetical protein SFX73_20030 [Kofleriaceae bacterium]|nr:hypothetical protein [Kofleriaceae bacterium]